MGKRRSGKPGSRGSKKENAEGVGWFSGTPAAQEVRRDTLLTFFWHSAAQVSYPQEVAKSQKSIARVYPGLNGASKIRVFGKVSVPKGLQDSAQGFNPGNRHPGDAP